MVLLHVALAACCLRGARIRPRAGRVTATVFVAVLAVSTVAVAAVTLVLAESEDDPESIAGALGAVMLVLGLLLGVLAAVAQFTGEVGRWVAAVVLGVLAGLVLRATLTEAVDTEAPGGAILVMLIGLGMTGSAALLVGGSKLAAIGERQGFPYGRSANLGG